MTSDLELLRQFAHEHSQDAFTEIVQRHVNLVYSAALRQVRSPQLAEEVSQSVFSDLARNADKINLTAGSPLTAWLYAVTRRTAIDVVRKESRRQLREQIAMEMQSMNATANDWLQIAPLLDEAMAALDETDRTAILLRYFENKNLRDVGNAMNISDDAAQKRVSRAIERLREFFSKQKVTVGATGLVALISANAVQSAPVGLAAAILAATSGITATVGMTMIHKILIVGLTAVAIGSGIYSFHLQKQITALQQQQTLLNQQIAQLSRERDDATNQLAAVQQENDRVQKNENELLRLRGEATHLRRQLELAGKNRTVDAARLDSNTNPPPPQIHIKARFLMVSKDALPGIGGSAGLNGILTSDIASNTLKYLKARDGVEVLAEPEVVTLSGRQAQMRATQVATVITNFSLVETNDVPSILPQTTTVETGPVIDVMPFLLSDGYTIEMPVVATMTDFLGYEQSSTNTPVYTSSGQKIDMPTASPQFYVQETTNSLRLLDGQTMVFTLGDKVVPTNPNATLVKPDGSAAYFQGKTTLVFVTANLIDAAGNLINADAGNFTNVPPQAEGHFPGIN